LWILNTTPVIHHHQIVALALSAQVESWRIRDDMKTRALRAKREDFVAFLDASPDVPPLPGDEL
jgi:hypothetical protein